VALGSILPYNVARGLLGGLQPVWVWEPWSRSRCCPRSFNCT